MTHPRQLRIRPTLALAALAALAASCGRPAPDAGAAPPSPVGARVTPQACSPSYTFTNQASQNIYVLSCAAAGGNGTLGSPYKTITAAVNAAVSGKRVVVGPGVYREAVVIDKHSIALQADAETGPNRPEIRGSDEWTGWTQEGSYWVKADAQATDRDTSSATIYSRFTLDQNQCKPGTSRCRFADQLFINGAPQAQVTSLGDLGTGKFYVGSGKLYLPANPAGQVVEVTQRDSWVKGATDANGVGFDNIGVYGFVMTHSANRAQNGALSDGNGVGWVVEDNDFSHSHGMGLQIMGDNATVRDNKVHRHGQMGIGSGTVGGVSGDSLYPNEADRFTGTDRRVVHYDQLFEGNEVAYNNTEGFDPTWEAGGTKFTWARGLKVRGNEFHHNEGPGAWCDVYCDKNPLPTSRFTERDTVFEDNRAHHNDRAGIAYEISKNCQIKDNALWENGWGEEDAANHTAHRRDANGAALVVQTVENCAVTGNTLAWNADGILVLQEFDNSGIRDDSHLRSGIVVKNIQVAGNTVGAHYRDGDDTLFGMVPNYNFEQKWSFLIAFISYNGMNYTSPLFRQVNNNRGEANRYWREVGGSGSCVEAIRNRYAWNTNGVCDFGTLNGTPAGQGWGTPNPSVGLNRGDPYNANHIDYYLRLANIPYDWEN